jgi:glycerophosphoryl diester phosphodiesterase
MNSAHCRSDPGPNGGLHLGDSVSLSVRVISRHWRALAGFSLIFRIFEGALCAPLVAVVGKWLLRRTVLDSTALVSFLLSPRGILAVVFTATTLMTVRLVEHAGLSAIFYGGFQGRRVPALEAGRIVWRNLLALVRVSARFVGIGLVTVLPLLMVAGGFAVWLLPQHDVNYYLKLRPPAFMVAASVIGVVAVITAVVVVALVARWRWVVQVVIFEKRPASDAFARSAALSQGIRWKLAGAIIGVSLFSLGLGLIASLLGTVSASILLGVVGQGAASLAIAFGLLLLLRTILGVACTFLGSWVDAGLFTFLYYQRVEVPSGQASIAETTAAASMAPPRWVVPVLTVALLFFAGCAAWLALEAFSEVHRVSILAHRGVSTEAPENTLAAVRAAIAAGADYLETDIQLSKDDVLVVAHDSDFSRLGGVAKKVWELTYEEIRAIPLRQNAAPQFRNEVTPTFDALLAEAKGHIKVNIELKYYGDHEPELAKKVVEAVRAHHMLDQVVIQCLEYEPLLEVRKLAPEVPVGYLLSFNAREPSRLDVDFLSVQQNRLDGRFVRKAHARGQQVYAWTVNTVEDMKRQFDVGVDGVITDQSALARKTFDEMRARPKLERFTSQIRTWLAD